MAQAGPPAWVGGEPGGVVVVAPHPDDETLGVGGMLHDLSARGWRVTVVAVTDGEADDLPSARLRGWRISADALEAKRSALRAFTSQTTPAYGLPVLPDHVLARFLRPVEAFFV